MSKKQKKELKKIILAGVILAVLMIIEHVLEFPAPFDSHYARMPIYIIPYWIVGGGVVKKCINGIKNRELFDESLLMTVATIGAFATGENCEAVAVMLFYQVGEWFQRFAVGKSRNSITALMDIAPESANIEREDGTIEEVDPEDVEIGDILVIRAGDRIPVDGKVIEGESLINTAALTGESVPRTVRAGDMIISGCINGEGLLRVVAEKKYEDSTVSQILELVENATDKKSKTENFITRFARYYTPVVVFGAIALAVIPSLMYGNVTDWLLRACTFLVISCPCALVISVPLAFFGGVGAASEIGVLVKGSNYLELMAQLDTVVSDKTGTLTKGEFSVAEVLTAGDNTADDVIRTAACVESASSHPIAQSIIRYYGKEIDTTAIGSVENVSGKGLIADVNGDRVYVGNAALLRDNGIAVSEVTDNASTIVYVASKGEHIGTILISDSVKPEAKDAISSMKRYGVKKFVMLTGDRRETAEAVAAKLGVDEVHSELMPADKVNIVESLLSKLEGKEGRRLAFIGDGINDAPVLARADVGIAMGSLGSDAAIEAADVVIMDDDIRRIPMMIGVARKTVGISKQNIAFALIIKIMFLVLGALGIANMWMAVFADVGVAVICILNSMRMLSVDKSNKIIEKPCN